MLSKNKTIELYTMPETGADVRIEYTDNTVCDVQISMDGFRANCKTKKALKMLLNALIEIDRHLDKL